MNNIISNVGWFGFFAAFAYFIYYDNFAGKTSVDYNMNFRYLCAAAAALVLAGYVLKFLGNTFKVGKGRCKVCGKKIGKTETYCFDHLTQVVTQGQEKSRGIAKQK